MNSSVLIDREGAIATVTLNNPKALNAINGAMRDGIIAAMETLNADDAVRVIILTGAGDRAFSAGQDLVEAEAFRPEQVVGWMQHQARMFAALRNLDKPLVVAFNGVAAGTGFQMGLVADVRVGYAEMSIGQPEVHVGLASILGSYLMSLYLGYGSNVEMSLLGRLMDGRRAHALGLLSCLVEQAQVGQAARELAEAFAALPSNALRLTKQRFRQVTQAGFEDACRAVAVCHTEEYATGEPQRIMRAFLQARAERKRSAAGSNAVRPNVG